MNEASPRQEEKPRPGWWGRLRALVARQEESQEESSEEPFIYRADRVVGEKYRTLAWRLEQLRLKQSFQVITITSAQASEGKSTVALNLAAVLAERRQQQVLLIECDMRRPRLGEILSREPPGLPELLEGSCSLDEAIRQSDDVGFHFICVPEPVDDPVRLLSDTQRLRGILEAVRERYDYIILDAPPMLPVSDPDLLAQASDGVLFVVRAGETSARMLTQTLASLPADRVLGLVFNGTARGISYHYDAYYRYKKGSKGRGYRSYRASR